MKPNEIKTALFQARSALHEGNPRLCEDILRRILRIHPDIPDCYNLTALAAVGFGDYSSALYFFNRAARVAQDPTPYLSNAEICRKAIELKGKSLASDTTNGSSDNESSRLA